MAKLGRPPLWTDPKALGALIDTYLKNSSKPTLAGLAYAIGIDRKTLFNYSKKDAFFPTIKKARDNMLQTYEELLIYKEGNVAGIIFAMKNTGWRDRHDITSDDEKVPGPVVYLPKEDE